MNVVRQIRVVLWKNFTIRRRRWVRFEFESTKSFLQSIDFRLASRHFRNHLATFSFSHFNLGSNEKFNVLLRRL